MYVWDAGADEDGSSHEQDGSCKPTGLGWLQWSTTWYGTTPRRDLKTSYLGATRRADESGVFLFLGNRGSWSERSTFYLLAWPSSDV